MKKSVRILLSVVCVLMCLCLPFILCSPFAMAEGTEEAPAVKALPVDFSAGSTPDPNGWTEEGYSDETITVRCETREEDGVVWRIIYVDIAHPSQLRTAIAGKKVSDSRANALPSTMAESKSAIVAINGDYYTELPDKKSFEYRQGEKVRQKNNRLRDLLIIDKDGNFHTFIKYGAAGLAKLEAYLDGGGTIINAFSFGPVLVKDGTRLTMDKEYAYNPNGREPRAAIGQMGELSYVLVVAEGRIDDSKGVTHQELADFMFELGCVEAFNLDGGGTATLIFHGESYMTRSTKERSQSDIIYFASARDAE